MQFVNLSPKVTTLGTTHLDHYHLINFSKLIIYQTYTFPRIHPCTLVTQLSIFQNILQSTIHISSK